MRTLLVWVINLLAHAVDTALDCWPGDDEEAR